MDASGSFYEDERTVEEMLGSFDSRLHSKFRLLDRIWQELGLDETECRQYGSAAIHHLDNLLDGLTDEAQKSLRSLKKEVEESKNNLRNLYKELGDAPIEPELSGGMKDQLRLLTDLVKSLYDRKKRRLARYSTLHEEDKALSKALGSHPKCYLDGIVPSEDDLNILEGHIVKLRATKAERTRQYGVVKEKIGAIIEELEIEPQNDFEECVVCEDIDMFTLSSYNMECLNMYYEQLDERLKKSRAEAEQLRGSIADMWSRIPEHEKGPENFLCNYSDCRAETIRALKEEVERCRRVRLANLHKLIHDTRVEIRQWWLKCYFTREQCDEFTAFKSCDFTEELLESHDRELTRLKRFYSDYEALFKNIARRGELFKRYLELEKNATDPNRFSNRGGQLLKEEKERKYLSKELPQIDKSIEAEIAEWELETGKPFLVEGMPFREYVTNQWAEVERKKKLEKDLKTRIKKQQTHTEVLYGSRLVAATTKRRLPATPGTAMSTLLAPPEDAPSTKRGRVDVSKIQNTMRAPAVPNVSRAHVSKDNKSLTTRSRNLRRSNRLLHAPAAFAAAGPTKKSGIPAPSGRGGAMGIGGGVVVERGGTGSSLRPLRLVNKMVAASPMTRPALQDETLKDAIVASGPGPVRVAADSGIDCSVASVGPYHDFALPMRSSEDNDSTRHQHQSSLLHSLR